MEELHNLLNTLSGLLWETPSGFPFLVALLLGTGVFLTIRLGFVQIRKLGHGFKVVAGKYDNPANPGEVTHFQALSTALSATVGIGNIAGVALAIHYGGPGALFWMWVTAFLGMATKFSECTLALKYRTIENGSVAGGPMYYMKHGLGGVFKWLAPVFAVCAVISSFGSGDAIQANTLAQSMHSSFGIPPMVSGLFSTMVVGAVILGGIRRIANATARMVPFMSILYVGSAILILLINHEEVPMALWTIVEGAFNPPAALGGFAGSTMALTMLWGVKRGLFSNEAGQGSAPIAHAAARTDKPVREGVVALLEPFVDTMIICTMTGLVIVTTGVWKEKKEVSLNLGMKEQIAFIAMDATPGHGGTLDEQLDLVWIEGGQPQARVVRNEGLLDQPRFFNNDGILFTGKAYRQAGGWIFEPQGGKGIPGAQIRMEGLGREKGASLTAWAFKKGLSPLFDNGDYLVALAVLLFAISTAISWSYYGDRCIFFLFGTKAILPYRLAFLAMHFLGAIFSLEMVWTFGDLALGLMALPNLFALILLSGKVSQMSREYFISMKTGGVS